MVKRLFYFTGYRLSVLYFKGKELAGTSSFEPTDAGLEKFSSYLQQTPNISSKFLVDVIEEDFRQENIPHVGSKDRKAVIGRLVDRFYRASQNYSHSEVIGREKGGRKDDKVLIGAMTNPQLIQPWISIIDENKVPLSGIWTLPLVSKLILKTIKADSGVVLLVSQQVNSNVRQTLFRDGKLITSRQSIINQDMSDITAIGDHAAPEVKRTIDFLRGQGLVKADETIDIHILGGDEQLLSLQNAFRSSEKQSVTIHRIVDINEKLGLAGVSEKYSDGIFAWLCISQNFTTGHYGDRKLFARYHNKLAASALLVASVFVIIFAALITEANIAKVLEYEKSTVLLKQEKIHYKELYARKFKDFEEVFENAGLMNSAVDLANQIKLNAATSPLDFMIALSEMLSDHRVGRLHIDKIEWDAINIEKKTGKVLAADFTSDLPAKHHAVVSGRIEESEYNYRASVAQIQTIIQLLRESPRVEMVKVLKMPVDLRSESKFSAESGVEVNDRNERQSSGMFSLEIILKEPDRA